MEFCSKCGGLMLPKKTNKVTKLVCTKCGHSKKSTKKEIVTLKTKKKEKTGIAIISEEQIKKREDEKLLLEELYKDSLEYLETS